MKHVLLYTPAEDVTARAPAQFAAHRARAEEFHARGALLMTGPFADAQAHGAMGIFTSRAAAEEFAAGDPFMLHGVVRGSEVREWNELLAGSAALQVALDYFDAWTAGDLERAMLHIAGDIVCDAPAGRIEGAAAYREFIGGFLQILEHARLIAAFGDDTTALVMYDTRTRLVADAPGAECVTVADGRITRSRFIFDRAPFEAARRAAR
jgi:uncharacterized protein YciI/ketosteroid isomerase-like protein